MEGEKEEGGRQEGGEKRKNPTLLANECRRDDVTGTVGGEGEKQLGAVLILFAALKGMEGGQGGEFWETI